MDILYAIIILLWLTASLAAVFPNIGRWIYTKLSNMPKIRNSEPITHCPNTSCESERVCDTIKE